MPVYLAGALFFLGFEFRRQVVPPLPNANEEDIIWVAVDLQKGNAILQNFDKHCICQKCARLDLNFVCQMKFNNESIHIP
jgi:hypothetical protein